MAEEDTLSEISESSSSSSALTSPMSTPLRKVFCRISGLASSLRRNTAPHSRRIFHRDVEQQEFQYANSHCLSSYYSVFVARLAIMVMLAILIGLLTVLTWHFTKSYTAESLHSLAYGLRHELLQRPILRMWSVLNSTAEITTAQVKLSEYVMRKYSKPTNQAEQVELYEAMRDVTWAMFASRKALNAITINYKNGFVQAFHRDHTSNNTFYIYSDLTNYTISATESHNINRLSSGEGWSEPHIHGNMSAKWYREPLDPISGQKIGKAKQIPPEDLISIAGISQLADGVASWHVTVSKYMDTPLLSAALPVSDASNESIVAVVGVTTSLYSVGQLMKELVEFHSGHIYLTSQEGYLLATSANAPLLRNTSSGPKLTMAVDSQDDVIRLGAERLQKTYGNNFPPGHEVHEENVKLGDQQYYIDSFFLNLKRLPIVGVVIIPRQYIMGKVDERAVKTLVILISASLCILVIGCLCILILTKGVSKEMKLRAELISHLDARRRAEASSNYKSQFLANMSHELRTPMAAVIGLLDILMCDDCLNNEQFATVTQIRKCSTALLRLLNNILDLSKVESGKLVLEDAEFDLGRELEGLVDVFSVQCINHNVETVLDLSDDMPKLVRGDSGRVVQIFTNLISNSIKFTTSGHIILRGWCETSNNLNDVGNFCTDQKKSRFPNWTKMKQQGDHTKNEKDNKMTLWFELDDTGCGMDPRKWESVFESFEQADPSTTRTHGGTGLGLCIVRTLVNKMGGEIKVVKKNGPGTLMRLYLVLSTPVDSMDHHCQLDFTQHNAVVLLALRGSMSRLITSQWLRKIGLLTLEASEWNELTLILQELFQARSSETKKGFSPQDSLGEPLRAELMRIKDMKSQIFIIVADIGILDLSTDIWKDQLYFLDKYSGKAKFAWMLNHDTSNAIKMELRGKGHIIMNNKPLYKAKMVHILEAAMKDRNLELQKKSASRIASKEGNYHECLEIDSTQFETASSDDSDISELSNCNSQCAKFQVKDSLEETIAKPCQSPFSPVNHSLVELTHVHSNESNMRTGDPRDTRQNSSKPQCRSSESSGQNLGCNYPTSQGESHSKNVPSKRSLEGLRILLAEDTPVLQRVTTIMLEKMGAMAIAVGDGLQAVEAITAMLSAEEQRRECPTRYDLILMDCQMPRMDGYEATKAIRKLEAGSRLHVPIVALTAHAMSSDEAKCLEVGMDAYLTKPIDYKLMVSTILSLAQRRG
ncbi:histidine kinase 1-like isoform X1 [Cucurbita pepo subsp. pepo]|uniref:histidine kinase 1-like isoform X1 n=4 Tax=Cucurbita pepo subsp. pepo TaxID=3664 RepID=UPI000C9D2707|nr:histidine kinase 1-like isoform X1 [Cucurbita pepo subsp. pepo]